jgi:pentatricopeptide repeat protein
MATQAIQLFHQTPSNLILEPTYVSVLNACSHGGLVDEARSIFSKINNKTEKIYAAMVDLKYLFFACFLYDFDFLGRLS